MIQGGFRTVTGLIGRNNKQNYRISTPAAIISVSGTDHEVFYLSNDMPGALAGTYNKVNRGGILLTTGVGSVNVGPEQMGFSSDMNQLPQVLPINPILFDDATAVLPNDFLPEIGGGAALDAPVDEAQSEAMEPTIKGVEASKDINGVGELAKPTTAMFVPAPITWGGDLSDSYRKQNLGAGQSSVQHVQAVNLRAWTYVWQPWMAQVSGGVGLVNAQTHSERTSNNQALLNGRGALSAVPYSRFPFSASFYVNDNRAPTSKVSSATPDFLSTSSGFAVRQSYRPKSSSSSSDRKSVV